MSARKRRRSRSRSRRSRRHPAAVVVLVGLGGWLGWPSIRPYWPYLAAGLGVVLVGLALVGVVRYRRRSWRRGLLAFDRMTGPAFERAVAALLRRDGYRRVRVSGGAGDLGADVTGIDPTGRRVVVQCKRYAANRTVGSAQLQAFLGTYTRVHRAQAGLYVTTARFTTPARDLAKFGEAPIVLVDRDTLARWAAGRPLPRIDT